jgi:hypothetical protein
MPLLRKSKRGYYLMREIVIRGNAHAAAHLRTIN